MNKKPAKKPVKLPKVSPEFEQAVQALGKTKPISNADLAKWVRKQKKNSKQPLVFFNLFYLGL